MILIWIFKKRGGTCTGFIWLRIGTGGGALVKAVMNLRVTENAGNFLAS
jgi:hypothetical protein